MQVSFPLCSVTDEQVTLWIFSPSSFSQGRWHTMKSPNSMLLPCHGFKEIGSLVVCGAASIQPPHKERETGRGLRESSLCGGWRERVDKKIALVHQFSLIPTATINVSEMSYLLQAVPQAGLFFPLSLWWVSRTWSDKADRRAAIRWQSG